ncbi:DUF4231 domain-containing protein [Paenibacillus sp. M-152]|nr:DUF4231 domain-containing protein [Paenibacillus sp. M-152]
MDISEREYLAERLDDQINWYDKKSIECQKYYKRWKRAEIVAAALIPVLTSFSSGLRWIAIVIGALGACIALFESILSLHKSHENWIEYRGICETLRQEKYMYLTRTGIYKIADGAFNLLVERVESVISKENVNWANLHANEQKKEEPSAASACFKRLVSFLEDIRFTWILFAVDSSNNPISGRGF